MKLSEIRLPNYSKGEEIFNAVTHGVGIVFAFIATIIGISYATRYSEKIGIIAVAIYGGAMLLLFSMSTLYHALQENNKKIFRILDHCSIFLLIAGTYTPYTLITLKEDFGLLIFGIVWLIAILGITLNIINMDKFAKLSMFCYILSGWVIILFFPTLISNLGKTGSILLLSGGIVYTLGAVLYGFGKKIKYFHSIWHVFILIACILQYFSILLFVIR